MTKLNFDLDKIKEKSKELVKLLPSEPYKLGLRDQLKLFKYLNILTRKIQCIQYRINEQILKLIIDLEEFDEIKDIRRKNNEY